MIISHSTKYVFIAIPKTGTHTVRFALRPHFGPGDEEQVALFHHSKLITGNFQNRKNGHIRALEIKPYLAEDVWSTYFKFAFIRNPYERFVSACFFKHPLLAREYTNIPKCRAFMKLLITNEIIKKNLFFRPQSDYITGEKGEVLVDFIGQTETMDKDLEVIFSTLSLQFKPIEKINLSTHLPAMAYYDDELISIINHFYKKDFNLLRIKNSQNPMTKIQ